jgi:hypothetical protein
LGRYRTQGNAAGSTSLHLHRRNHHRRPPPDLRVHRRRRHRHDRRV